MRTDNNGGKKASRKRIKWDKPDCKVKEKKNYNTVNGKLGKVGRVINVISHKAKS